MLKACLQSFPVLHIGNSFQQHFSVALAYTVASRNRDDACPKAMDLYPFQKLYFTCINYSIYLYFHSYKE